MFLYFLRKHLNFRTRTRIVGSCNGVVCLADRKKVVLWNPATSDVKNVLNNLDQCNAANKNWIINGLLNLLLTMLRSMA